MSADLHDKWVYMKRGATMYMKQAIVDDDNSAIHYAEDMIRAANRNLDPLNASIFGIQEIKDSILNRCILEMGMDTTEEKLGIALIEIREHTARKVNRFNMDFFNSLLTGSPNQVTERENGN